MIIAIDGPAGSGKTTTAKSLARRLNIFYLDTGATYRALTLEALRRGLFLEDEAALAELADSINLRFDSEGIYLNGEDVSGMIRSPEIDRSISSVVAHPCVRSRMVALQRDLAKGKDCVVEGRDITTVVFPAAEYKFFLDADPDQRAKRRHKELTEKGHKIDYRQVKSAIESRDSADKNRKTGPLLISPEATVLDTTDLSIEEAVDEIIRIINESKK